MSTMVAELYDALRKAGVDEDLARSAAKAVIGIEQREQLATRLDIETLRREMAELKADIIKWNVGAMVVLTGIFAAIVRLS